MYRTPLFLFLIAFFSIRFARRTGIGLLKLAAYVGWTGYFVWAFCTNPAYREIVGFILVLPIILFGVICILMAPVARGSKPPEFF